MLRKQACKAETAANIRPRREQDISLKSNLINSSTERDKENAASGKSLIDDHYIDARGDLNKLHSYYEKLRHKTKLEKSKNWLCRSLLKESNAEFVFPEPQVKYNNKKQVKITPRRPTKVKVNANYLTGITTLQFTQKMMNSTSKTIKSIRKW